MDRVSLLTVGLALWALATVSTARAQADDAAIGEARQHFERGEQFYQSGNYALSRDEFLQVYALMEGHPNRGMVLYNIARCHDQLDQYAEAIANYERFLIEAPDETPERADARSRVAELRIRIRESGSGTENEAPAEQPAASPAAAGPSDTSPSDRGLGVLGVSGIAVMAAGAAAGVVAAITGGLAHGVYEDLSDVCGPDRRCPADYQDDAEYGSAMADASTVLTFVGIGTAAVGLVLLIIDLASNEASGPHARLLGPRGSTVGVTF